MHCVVRKLDSALVILAQHAGLQQQAHIRMHGAHIAADAPCSLAQL